MVEADNSNDSSYDNNNSYDVFLCHNGSDKSEISVLADSLKNKGIKPWFDDWNIAPGQNFINKLQSGIQTINCFAIFLGKHGLGQWQQDEYHSILHEAKKRNCKVIPVYLKTAPPDAEFPPFLQSQNIVDLRKTDKDELGRLIWGISDIQIDQTVYLAQVTVDLDDYRQQIINCLRQRGIRVLPQSNDAYPEDIDEFNNRAKKDIEQSLLAIQLLSKYPGKGPKDFVKIQSDLIKNSNKPCVLWRSRDLDIESISDLEHKSYIEQKEAKVLAISIEEFKDKVIQEHDILTKQKLETSKNKDTESLEHKTIFINAQEDDLELAQMISDQLKKWEIDCLKSIKYRNSRELKQDEKSKLEHSHGVIIVYGNTSPFWISQTSMRCRKITRDIYKKRKIPKAISIFNGPPPPKEDPGIDTKDIHTIDSETGIDTAKLYEFIEKINC